MKCPRCGNEMTLDTHRKYPINMCYECGYVERTDATGKTTEVENNFKHLKSLNFNETVAFLHKGLGLDRDVLIDWLDNIVE